MTNFPPEVKLVIGKTTFLFKPSFLLKDFPGGGGRTVDLFGLSYMISLHSSALDYSATAPPPSFLCCFESLFVLIEAKFDSFEKSLKLYAKFFFLKRVLEIFLTLWNFNLRYKSLQ